MLVTFVRRPVLAAVVSIFLILLGLLAMTRMPMALFPSIAPPEVNVTVEYTGANAETVTKAAIVRLERAINGVPGMKYMSSDAGNDGVGVVQILFETGTDPDVAAVNVQNRVNAVMGELPVEVVRNGVRIAKEENAILAYFSIFSSDPSHDEKFLYNFADLNVLAELKRVDGVGFADIVGAKEYAMRIWLEPDRMAAYGVSADEVLAALESANVEAAPGSIGENSGRGSALLQYTLRYTGKLNTVAQYEQIPVRATAEGEILRIRDVAHVEFGTNFFDVEAKFNGQPSASILLKQLPGSNAREVISHVKQRLERLHRESFLPGMDYEFSFDISTFLDASVREVVRTLIEAFLLVALVVFVFLKDWRATVIPVVAVPISLVGTLVFIEMLGFSLNLITLFALVLAIGIVVDNAIVVVEAVHLRMTETRCSAFQATIGSLAEIAPAIFAITLVMGSVFIPLAFLAGPAGVFYGQFALTIAIAIALSGVTALTLTPAMCAVMLRPRHQQGRGMAVVRVGGAFDRLYGKIESGYAELVERIAPSRAVTFGLLLAFSCGTWFLVRMVPRGFIPDEDQGTFYVSVNTPPGATLERTKDVVDKVARACRELEPVESVASMAGQNILSDGTGPTYGTCIVNLLPWSERSADVHEVIAELEGRIANVHEADIECFPPPSVPGYGNASGFELRLLDKTGRGDNVEMGRVVDQFVQELRKRSEIGSAFTIFNASYPQYTIALDADRAAKAGLSAEAAMGALQTLVGSEYATNFVRFGQTYKVMVQTAPEYRATPEQVLRLHVKNDRGNLVPMSDFLVLEKSYGVDQLTRYNMFPSAEISGNGSPGFSSGEVLRAVQEVADEKLPRGFAIDWAGISRDEVSAGNQGLIVGLIALVFVFLVLAAQYESFLLPLAVLLSLAPGLAGAFGFLVLTGLENNIYTHIALVVLIGLLGKNSILIVEFAEQRCRAGASPIEAVVQAARQRLRPILMTSFAFVAGLVPLALATGAGSVANRTIGTATIGGMLMGTAFGVVMVPGLYFVCKGWSAALGRRWAPETPRAEFAA